MIKYINQEQIIVKMIEIEVIIVKIQIKDTTEMIRGIEMVEDVVDLLLQ